MLVCTQQLQQACLLASKLLNIFLVCSRCRARCAYGGLCAFYISFLFPSSHQNAVCKSHYPICAASLDKTDPARSCVPDNLGVEDEDDDDDDGGLWGCGPPVSRLGRCSGAATGVLQVRFDPLRGSLRRNEPLSHTGWNNLFSWSLSPKGRPAMTAYYCREKARSPEYSSGRWRGCRKPLQNPTALMVTFKSSGHRMDPGNADPRM